MLDHGGLRRATLRGELNLTKRQLGAALTYNLSLLLRHLTGTGTPKQWLAGVGGLVTAIWSRLEPRKATWRWTITFRRQISKKRILKQLTALQARNDQPKAEILHFSTAS